jgi:hypothetical protein
VEAIWRARGARRIAAILDRVGCDVKAHLLLWPWLVAIGCHPHPAINSFHVTPTAYCPSSFRPIDIDWRTDAGATTLQIAPDDPAPRNVKDKGKISIRAHDVTITLTVKKGELAPHIIQPVHDVGRRPMSAIATDVGGGKCVDDWVISDPTDFDGGNNAFDPQAYPSLISNVCGPHASSTATCHRAVKVQHGGKSWPIAAGGVLDLTDESVSMVGPWTLSQQLLPGEECGSLTANSALEVALSVEIDCTKGAAYE